MDINFDDHLNRIASLCCDTEIDKDVIEKSITEILLSIGEDPNRDGLKSTPKRVAKSYEELLSGYRVDPRKLINGALFEVSYDEMIVVRDIEFFSLCEHHMLPFIGRIHVAYIPKKKIIGLSKIPRIVDMFSKRLQIQERMTQQIAEFVDAVLDPLGVGVVVEAIHLCSMIRGVKKQQASMTTSAMLGAFRTRASTRVEFLENISRGAEKLKL
jgi:GTP cyclohydrolase I